MLQQCKTGGMKQLKNGLKYRIKDVTYMMCELSKYTYMCRRM